MMHQTLTSSFSTDSTSKPHLERIRVSIPYHICSLEAAPSRLNIVARAKWDAWKANGKISQDDAKLRFAQELAKRTPAFKPKL